MTDRADRQWRTLELIGSVSEYLGQRGVSTPRLDAELLLAHASGKSRMDLYVGFQQIVPADVLDVYRELVRRRAAREPVAYIVGEKEFWGLPFWVTRDVLVPRPDTETLVETVVGCLQKRPAGAPIRVLDVGTGSGAIVIAIAREIGPDRMEAVAADISAGALAVARKNASRHGVESRIAFRCGDLFGALHPRETFTAVVSNLPYIPSADCADLEPEIAEHEPRLALDGGADGLCLLRRLVEKTPARIVGGGWLALEVGAGQSSLVVEMVRATQAFVDVATVKDLAGVERVVVARRSDD
ncbi:peptide chain release factor N(5)-glutamine methyltransferase [Candidatus Poribacteria bacterium]|nr:peptide chain release factor N(5)-glutamine methyltransferase [Candidatus Poribacteria bacterium]